MTAVFPVRSVSLPKKFLFYLAVLALVQLADALMTYIAPVVIERTVQNAGIMGIIIASSSLIGMVMDFVFAKTFVGKKFHFFLRFLLAIAFFFPLSLLFFKFIPSFIFGMVIWGVYFEAMVFSNYHAIHEFVEPHLHAKAWGAIMLLRNFTLVVGPFVASRYGGETLSTGLYLAIIFYIIAMVLFILLKKQLIWPRSSLEIVAQDTNRSFRQEVALWKTFSSKLWPLLFFLFLVYLIDSAFSTVGPLFTEQLKHISMTGSIFLSLYSLPGLFIGLLAGWLSKPFGKKRISFLSGVVSGIFLVVMSYQSSVTAILGFTFIASIGLGIIFPELLAVFEDYMSRVGKSRNDLIGLTAIFASLAYVIGPILNGFIFMWSDAQMVFRIWGVCIFIFSVLLFFIVPRKVLMPQQELQEIVQDVA